MVSIKIMLESEFLEIYSSGYKSEHSDFLNYIFDIRKEGVDYYNPFNLGFEFKECYGKHLWFKIPYYQLCEFDFIVFCIKREHFYIVDKRDLLEQYTLNAKTERINMRINTVKLLAFYECENALILKNYIDEITEVYE